MTTQSAGVAIIACPLCHKRHTLRVNAGRVGVECGATAEVLASRSATEASVWPAGRDHLPGRMATIITIAEAA